MTALLTLAFCAFITACVSHLWDVCLQDGMIFGKLGNKLHYSDKWYAKPLGGCVVCANVWHAFAGYVVYAEWTGFTPESPWHVWPIVFVALSSFFTRVINRWID